MQKRLRIYLIFVISTAVGAAILPPLLEQGPLQRFFVLQPVEEIPIAWKLINAVSRVVRRVETMEPTYPAEFNSFIPSYYYTIRPFEPRPKIDFQNLDCVLHNLKAPVIIDVGIKPTDIAQEQSYFSKYLNRLQNITRAWNEEDSSELNRVNYLGKGTDSPTENKIRRHRVRREDPLASELHRSLQRFAESFSQPNLLFHIAAAAETPLTAELVSSIFADSIFTDGSYRKILYKKEHPQFQTILQNLQQNQVIQLPMMEQIRPGKDSELYAELQRLAFMAPLEELTSAFRLPIASLVSPYCIRKNTDPSREKLEDLLILGYDAEFMDGNLLKSETGIPRGISIDDLCKHLGIFGNPGSGKTIDTLNLIIQFHKKRIPFLVIECAKTEYRNLKTLKDYPNEDVRNLANELQIYTIRPQISPFRLNPLWRSSKVSIEEHIENLIAGFMAAFPIAGPLEAILRKALIELYEEYPDPQDPPTMSDLILKVKQVMEQIDYSASTQADLQSALIVRLETLTQGIIGKILQCKSNIPSLEQLTTRPTILELDGIPNDMKCLISLFVFTTLLEYLKTQSLPMQAVRFAIIVDEAHNIVGRNTNAAPSESNPDPKAYAAKIMCQILTECRGEKIAAVIADQFPSTVAAEVIKATGTKISHRLTAEEDRHEIGAAMGLSPIEVEELARLKVAEAFIYPPGYYKPRRIQTLNPFGVKKPGDPPIGKVILPLIQSETWFREAAQQRIQADLYQLQIMMDEFDQEQGRFFQRLAALRLREFRLLVKAKLSKESYDFSQIAQAAAQLEQQWQTAMTAFVRKGYRPALEYDLDIENQNIELRKIRDQLVQRFQTAIEPDWKAGLAKLHEMQERCKKLEAEEMQSWAKKMM